MNTPFLDRPKTQLREEIESLIQEGGGYVSPHRVVEWARTNPESALHRRFQWDDAKAAAAYRLQQARAIIQVHVETVAETGAKTRAFVSLERHRNRDEGYQSLRDILDDPIEHIARIAEAL